jgi:hypothetical protein
MGMKPTADGCTVGDGDHLVWLVREGTTMTATNIPALTVAEQRAIAFVEIDRVMARWAQNKISDHTAIIAIDTLRQTAPGYDYNANTGRQPSRA